MRIERLELDGFGRFAGVTWRLGPGLTVLLGPNEAGKTTLLNGIRALLFGFEATREGRAWYPAFAGGRRGGRLTLITAAGDTWSVERHGERGGTGSLVVRAPNGNTGGQETLDRLLAGVDRELLTNVFAFGLGELQALGSLAGEGVRSRIYGAGSGLGGMSAADLEQQLRSRQEAIFRPRGRDQDLNRVAARMEELRERIAELEQEPARFEALHRELAEVGAERDRTEKERRACAESAARARRIGDAMGPAAALVVAEAELATTDPATDDLPDGTDAELVRLLAEQVAAEDARVAAERAVGAVDARIGALTVDERLLEQRDEIVALADERPLQAARIAGLPELRASHAGAVAELTALAARAGGSAAWLLGLDDSVAAIQATRDAAAHLDVAQRRLERAEARLDTLQRAEAQECGTDDLADVDPAELAARRAAVRALTEDRLRSTFAAGERERAAALRTLVASGTALLAGVAVLAVLLTGSSPILAGAVVATGVVVAVVAVRLLAPPTTRAPASRHAALLAAAGLPPDADDAAVERAGDALAAAQAGLAARDGRHGLAVGRDGARHDAAREREEALAAVGEAGSTWAAWVRSSQLPEGASPEAARQVLALVDLGRRAHADADATAQRLAADVRADDAYGERVDGLLERLGRRPVPPEARIGAVLGLVSELDATRAAADRCAALHEERRRAERVQAQSAERAERASAMLSALLERHGVPDAVALRERLAVGAARRGVHARVRELRATLGGIAGGDARVAELLGLIAATDPDRQAVERQESERRAVELDARMDELSSRAGELRLEAAQLEQGAELGRLRQELAVAEGRATALAREWAVRAIALRLLEETRRRYERERQPRVVQDAAGYFERITGGAYERIVAAPGEATVRVESATGAPRLTDELSRGTAEQLYLALRFGLIEQFARTAEALPVVMDDILVNFDEERAARAAAAVRSLAERHQVLYFTCHPWTARLLDPDGGRTLGLD